jgi:fumarylacetoacetase
MSGSASGWGSDHLPYGVFSVGGGPKRIGVRFDDTVLDLYAATGRGEFAQPSLNAFLSLGREAWESTRAEIRSRLGSSNRAAVPLADVTLHLPFEVGDYVDFYCSLDHATNVGRIFRPDGEALTPNWRHLPIGYHGRSGTVVVSGTDVVRPCGQRLPAGSSTAAGGPQPEYGATRRLDIEAELGFVIGTGSALGTRIGVDDFRDHVFGVVGLNDWSARDIQAWEYVPLGPFLGKSFATTISAWVTPLQALEDAWVDLPEQDPEPLPYLVSTGSTNEGGGGLAIDVEVVLNGEVVSRPPYASMYWSPAQMLAHLTVNGASTRPGDLFASGTISGPERDQRGSFLELSWGGWEPFGDGRTFLEDGDEVVLRYSAGSLVLGEVAGTVRPAREVENDRGPVRPG